jgi:FtsP/CotA-like multicopper oxidase with cupredoxin domain
MQFRVTRNHTETSSVPSSLRPLPELGPSVLTRTFDFGQARVSGMWTINGQGFDPDRFDAQPVLGTTETWVLHNTGGSNHFIHIHEEDQQLVSRNGKPPAPYELQKDTWNISANQTVVVKLRFTDNLGAFAFHCHILEHEDMSMMSQFQVVN